MKTLTKTAARAGAMTAEEAGVATTERALQLEGSTVALLFSSTTLPDWERTLKQWSIHRPWQFLPEEEKTKFKKWHEWTAARLKFNGEPLNRDRLVALLAGLHGSVAKAQAQIQKFEKEVEQPLVTSHGGKREKQGYPDNHGAPLPSGRGTNTGYLMSRLLRLDPDVQDKIGKGKEYASINAAAQSLGVITKRQRYELNPDVNLGKAAGRIVDVLGKGKAAELVNKLSLLISE